MMRMSIVGIGLGNGGKNISSWEIGMNTEL
jgi:hypothetical protein